MPIRCELRPLYPPHWRELSAHVRFERADSRCQGCGRPHLARLRCLTTRHSVSGVDRISPIGPHSQDQKIAATTTEKGVRHRTGRIARFAA